MFVAAMVVTAACSASAGDTPSRSTSVPRSSEPLTTTSLALPAPWVPSVNEPAPEVKVAATRVIQVVATYAAGGGSLDAARERLEAHHEEPAIADGAAALLDPEAAGTVDIVYPQLAGLEATEASVMVVARFTTTTSTVRTVDVRLARGNAGWRATAIASVGGEPPPAPRLTPARQALLDNPDVDLPDSARWDLEAGHIDDRIADLMLRIAAGHRVRVTVFATGHPVNVFGTDRTSNHGAGRGVDIWSIDGKPVAEEQSSSAVASVVKLAIDAGATEVGAPVDSDGRGGIVFTNTVHRDHVHLAFKR